MEIYEMKQAWKQVEESLVQSVNLDHEQGPGMAETVKAPVQEVDSPEDAIERRDKMEKMADKPHDMLKTIKLDGTLADILDRQIRSTGETEWTDGQGDGPFLPLEVEDYITKVANNTDDTPFTVRFIKYGSAHPQEGRLPPLYVEYQQENLEDPNLFRR